MADQEQNPGRKWRHVENDGDGNKYFNTFRFTPYTTDVEFYRDPVIYETDDVARSTQEASSRHDTPTSGPRGNTRPDEQIQEEIDRLLSSHGQMNAAGLQVHVKDGIVTLSGNINSQYERDTAEKMVENVFGVLGVINNLKINRG